MNYKHTTQPSTHDRAACERVPLADDLDGVLLPGLLVCAPSADGEAALSQSAVLQVHLIAHIERRVLQRETNMNSEGTTDPINGLSNMTQMK